jgi:hypothetical protein
MTASRTRRPQQHRWCGAVVFALVATLCWSAAAPAAPNASITGSFGDSCRDLAAHSSKDISHVELRYADGRVVKDEHLDGADFAIDGESGQEMASATVKSGTTTEQFACSVAPPAPPTAVLERKAGKSDDQHAEGSWTSADCVHDVGVAFCAYGLGVAEPSVSFRGVASADPNDDIVSWSMDFGDGTSTGGSWPMPAEITHDYGQHVCVCTVILTLTDAASHADSDTMSLNIDNDGLD